MKEKGNPLTIKDGVVIKCRKNATEVVIPEGVTAISEEVFYKCASLKSISIPASVKEIGNQAFGFCDALAEVRYSGTKEQWVHIAGLGLLETSELLNTSVLCADGTLKLEERADGFRMFGSIVCGHADKDLVTLNIPECATKIASMSFLNSELTSVTIPESVTEIGTIAFHCSHSLVLLTIAEHVTKIGYMAFAVCSSLVSVTIPASVKEIERGVFSECVSLTEIRFGGTMAQWEAIKKGEGWYLHTPATHVKCADGEVPLPPYTIENGVLERWYRNDAELVVPEGVVKIGWNAFIGCASLVSVTIPEGVTEIYEAAFSWCKSLTKVMLSESVTKIDEGAFANCKSLTEIRFGGTVAQWEAVEKDDDWNYGVPATAVHCADGDARLYE